MNSYCQREHPTCHELFRPLQLILLMLRCSLQARRAAATAPTGGGIPGTCGHSAAGAPPAVAALEGGGHAGGAGRCRLQVRADAASKCVLQADWGWWHCLHKAAAALQGTAFSRACVKQPASCALQSALPSDRRWGVALDSPVQQQAI